MLMRTIDQWNTLSLKLWLMHHWRFLRSWIAVYLDGIRSHAWAWSWTGKPPSSDSTLLKKP